jgi:hypothetical protein
LPKQRACAKEYVERPQDIEMGWPTGFENAFAIFENFIKTPIMLANKGALSTFQPENLS